MRPGALLFEADYHGTLAATRSLGRAGVAVTVADWRRFVPARWSRFVARTVRCPDMNADPDAFLTWLVELGQKESGLVLLPTTDDLAFLFARHRDTLAKFFRLDSPPIEAVYTLLNKWRLREACEKAGFETPRTWLPDRFEGTGLPYPLLIKPQTQTLLWPHQKGRVVREAPQLSGLYTELRAQTRHAQPLLEFDPSADRPVLQELLPSRGVYNLSGFIDETGELFVVSASRKVLQKPRVMGVGLCFQEAKVDDGLARRLRHLCRKVGYHGLFEVEFLEHEKRQPLIDFNPRCYGQMGLDVARGSDLPLMAYFGAAGDRTALKLTVDLARRRLARGAPAAWCDRISLELFLKVARAARALDGATAGAWNQWLAVHDPHLTDAVIDREDWKPGVISAATGLWRYVRHPRSMLRAVREA